MGSDFFFCLLGWGLGKPKPTGYQSEDMLSISSVRMANNFSFENRLAKSGLYLHSHLFFLFLVVTDRITPRKNVSQCISTYPPTGAWREMQA